MEDWKLVTRGGSLLLLLLLDVALELEDDDRVGEPEELKCLPDPPPYFTPAKGVDLEKSEVGVERIWDRDDGDLFIEDILVRRRGFLTL